MASATHGLLQQWIHIKTSATCLAAGDEKRHTGEGYLLRGIESDGVVSARHARNACAMSFA
jgi:hypothetical protein